MVNQVPNIIPIKELKDTANISNKCHETDEPIFITKNGYGDMVLMSLETYQKLTHNNDMYRDLKISRKQIQDGQVKDAREALSDVRGKYGL